jgi:hypothetical protein
MLAVWNEMGLSDATISGGRLVAFVKRAFGIG